MKDIVISAKRAKTEVAIYAICFILAFLTNVASIIFFDTEWSELLQYMGYVVVLSLVYYAITLIARGVIWAVKRVFRKG